MVEVKFFWVGLIWFWVFGFYCLIYGFFVVVIFGNLIFGILELVVYFVIDLVKSVGVFGRGDFFFYID